METLIVKLSSNVDRITDRIRDDEVRVVTPQTPIHNSGIHQADQSLTPKSQELTRIFKIPDRRSSPIERELFFVQAKMAFEQPITQDRNKHEVAFIFRSIKVMLEGPMDNTARKVMSMMLVRAKELTLVESSGVKFATTYASHILLETESGILSAAHNAALLADRRQVGANHTMRRAGKSRRRSRDREPAKPQKK